MDEAKCLIYNREHLIYMPHAVAFSAFIICSYVYGFVAMYVMCVLFVSLGSSVTPNIFFFWGGGVHG